MKKRFFALLLVLALLPASVSGARATGLACFVGVNNTLTALSGNGMPYYENGVLYIPYTAFHAEPGGVFVAYDEVGKTLALSQIYVRLVYDLAAGTVTDETGSAQPVSVSYRDGLLYIPATQAASHFGLSVTLLESESGCPIIRFTDGSQTMDDVEFTARSETLISLILENNGQQPGEEDPENPGPDDGPDGEDPAQEQPATVYLAFAGEAVSTETLGHLRALELQGTFFLTEAQLLDNVELVRSIYAEGHRIGLAVEPGTEDVEAALQAANEALDAAVFGRSVFALLPADAPEPAGYRVIREPELLPTAADLPAEPSEPQLLICRSGVLETLEALVGMDASMPQLLETSRYSIPQPPEQ